jgi:hypothetical protein
VILFLVNDEFTRRVAIGVERLVIFLVVDNTAVSTLCRAISFFKKDKNDWHTDEQHRR